MSQLDSVSLADDEPFDDRLARRIAVAVAELRAPFVADTLSALAQFERRCLDALATGADTAALAAELRDFAHDQKGQGASFGMPLAGEVAASLHRLTTRCAALDTRGLHACLAHLCAIRAVIQPATESEGEATGAALMAWLRRIAARD